MMRRDVLQLLGVGSLLAGCQAAAPAVQAIAVPAVVIPPAPVAVPRQERRVILTINFGLNSYRIDPSSLNVVANLAAALRDERLRGATFEVNGHTDASGQLAHNIALSFLRASAVVDQLHSRGVLHATIRAQGFGPLQLMTPTEPFRSSNRRVEVIALS